MSGWYALYFTLCPLPLVLWLDTTECMVPRQSCPVFSIPNIRYLNLSLSSFLSHLFSRLKQWCQLPQALLPWEQLQALNHLYEPLLDWVQDVCISFMLGSPELHIALQRKFPKCWAEQRCSNTMSFHGRDRYSLTEVVNVERMKFKNDGICNQGI